MLNRANHEATELRHPLADIESILAKPLEDIQQALPINLLKNLNLYERILIVAAKKQRFDVLMMLHDQAPLSKHKDINDFTHYSVIEAIFKTGNPDMIKWFIDNNPQLKAKYQAQYVIERAIIEGNLTVLKILETYDTYGDIIKNGSVDYYKNAFLDFNYENGHCLPPVMTAIASEQFEILKWLVDEKGHSLTIPADIFKQDIIHFTCSFTNCNGEFNREHYLANNKRTQHAIQRINILKWLIEEKKMLITHKYASDWFHKEIDLFQLIILDKPQDTTLTFPIFKWLLTSHMKLFKISILESLENDLARYTLNLPDNEISSLFTPFLNIIRYCQQSTDETLKNHSVSFLLQMACGNQAFAKWALLNTETMGINNVVKQDLMFFGNVDPKNKYAISEETKLSDHAIRTLLWDAGRTSKTLSRNDKLNLLEKIESKTPAEITELCINLKNELNSTTSIQPAVNPPFPRNLNLNAFARLPPPPQLQANIIPLQPAAPHNRDDLIGKKFLLADKLDHYLDQANTLSPVQNFQCYQEMLLAKIEAYELQHEFNLCKVAYARLLKLCNQSVKNNLFPKPIKFARWGHLYPAYSLETDLLSNIDSSWTIQNPRFELNPVQSFFKVFDRILEIADPQHATLLSMLHDCMELIGHYHTASKMTDLSFKLNSNWENYLNKPVNKAIFDAKLLALKEQLEKLNKLTAIIAGSATPFISLVSLIQSKDQKIAALENRISALEANQRSTSSSSFFQDASKGDALKKRPREDQNELDQEHNDKRQRTLDKWLKR